MQPGAQPTPPVLTTRATVTTSGRVRHATQLSLSREIATDLPGEVVGGGEVTAATGSLSLVADDVVMTRAVSPWAPAAGWPPRAADACTVDLTVGETTCRALTGRVDSASGTLGTPGQVQAEIVDDIDRLRRLVTMRPRIARYNDRPTALWSLVNAASQCGYSTGHLWGKDTVLAAPCNAGSLTPLLGDQVNSDAPVSWQNELWGFAPKQCVAQAWTFVPNGVTGRCIDTTFDVGKGSSASSWSRVSMLPNNSRDYPGLWFAQCTPTTIAVSSSIAGVSPTTGVTGDIATVTRTSAWTRVRVRVVIDSSTAYRVFVWAWDPLSPAARGVQVAKAYKSLSYSGGYLGRAQQAWELHTRWQDQEVYSDGPAIAGIVVDARSAPSVPGQIAYDDLIQTPNLKVTLDPRMWPEESPPLAATPTIVSRVGSEIIKEIASAVLAAVWIDELGTLRVVGRHALRSQDVVASLTATSSLLDLQWATDLSSLRHQVVVTAKMPTLADPAWRSGIRTIWVAPDLTLMPGEVYEGIIHPEEGVDWIGVATTVQTEESVPPMPSSGSWTRPMTLLGKDGSSQGLDASITRLDDQSYKVRVSAPSSNTAAVTNRLSDSYAEADLRGTPTPLIRASNFVTWADSNMPGTPVGPDAAPDLEHDGGPWLQDAYYITRVKVAEALASWLTTGTPRVESMTIVPDPRIQLGDRVTVTDDVGTGVVLDGIVAGISWDVAAGSMTQRITLRVLAVTTGVSLDQRDAAWSDRTLTAFDAAWPSKSLTQYDASPLAGA